MKKVDTLRTPVDEGWVVQVYGRDRRLLCVLEPSHGWIFLVGCGVGIVLSIMWINLARYTPSGIPTEPTQTPKLQVD